MSDDIEEVEIVSGIEEIELKPHGTSKAAIIPAFWRRTIPELKRPNLIFESHVERSFISGRLRIILEVKRVQPSTPQELKQKHAHDGDGT